MNCISIGERKKIKQKDLGCGTRVTAHKSSHLPSRSPIHPTVKEEIIPPMANTETERDQYMVRMGGELAGSSLVSDRGTDVPSVLPQGSVTGTGTVPSSPEPLVACLSGGAMPSTRP